MTDRLPGQILHEGCRLDLHCGKQNRMLSWGLGVYIYMCIYMTNENTGVSTGTVPSPP